MDSTLNGELCTHTFSALVASARRSGGASKNRRVMPPLSRTRVGRSHPMRDTPSRMNPRSCQYTTNLGGHCCYSCRTFRHCVSFSFLNKHERSNIAKMLDVLGEPEGLGSRRRPDLTWLQHLNQSPKLIEICM